MLKVEVTMAEGLPYLFRGDVDAYVDEAGTVRVFDYALRNRCDMSDGMVLAVPAGHWTKVYTADSPEEQPTA